MACQQRSGQLWALHAATAPVRRDGWQFMQPAANMPSASPPPPPLPHTHKHTPCAQRVEDLQHDHLTHPPTKAISPLKALLKNLWVLAIIAGILVGAAGCCLAAALC